jgi:hypothetical protein
MQRDGAGVVRDFFVVDFGNLIEGHCRVNSPKLSKLSASKISKIVDFLAIFLQFLTENIQKFEENPDL